MIAIFTTCSDWNVTSTTYTGTQTSYTSGYTISYTGMPKPLPLKLFMKLMAEKRMKQEKRLRQLHPIKYKREIKPLYKRPIQLRAVRINANEWGTK